MTLGERIGQALHDAGIGPVGRVVLPAEQPGEVPQELLFVQRGPRLHAVASIADLGIFRSVFTFGTRDLVTGFLADKDDGDDVVGRTVARVSAWLDSPRSAWPNALDFACTVLVLLRPVLRPGTFLRLSTWGEWDEKGASGASVGLGGAEEWGPFVTAWHDDPGLSVRITGDSPDTTRTVALPTFESADAAMAGLIAEATRAVEAWRAFTARPLRADRVAHAIVAALRGGWSVRASEGDWPHRRATAAVWLNDHLGEHCVLTLDETDRGITGPGFEVRSRADFDAAVSKALAYVADWKARLTPDKLEPGRRYRVRTEGAGVGAGALLRFVRAEYVPHDGVTRYHFNSDKGPIELWEGHPDSDAILADLGAWLAPL